LQLAPSNTNNTSLSTSAGGEIEHGAGSEIGRSHSYPATGRVLAGFFQSVSLSTSSHTPTPSSLLRPLKLTLSPSLLSLPFICKLLSLTGVCRHALSHSLSLSLTRSLRHTHTHTHTHTQLAIRPFSSCGITASIHSVLSLYHNSDEEERAIEQNPFSLSLSKPFLSFLFSTPLIALTFPLSLSLSLSLRSVFAFYSSTHTLSV
jgi:hypothetical protein